MVLSASEKECSAHVSWILLLHLHACVKTKNTRSKYTSSFVSCCLLFHSLVILNKSLNCVPPAMQLTELNFRKCSFFFISNFFKIRSRKAVHWPWALELTGSRLSQLTRDIITRLALTATGGWLSHSTRALWEITRPWKQSKDLPHLGLEEALSCPGCWAAGPTQPSQPEVP